MNGNTFFSMRMFALLGFLVLMTNVRVCFSSILPALYARVLGNDDVKKEYKDVACQALKEYGVAGAEHVLVKKMNPLGSFVASVPVSSFTAFGIWLDEKYLDDCTPAEQMFQMYHEAAHYAKRHHLSVMKKIMGASLVTLVGLICINRVSRSSVITTGSALIALPLEYFFLLPHVIKKQEKEADIIAAHKLCSLKRTDVVTAHITDLKRYDQSLVGTLWWFSPREQIAYLQHVVDARRKEA